jgi:hypothetical protein
VNYEIEKDEEKPAWNSLFTVLSKMVPNAARECSNEMWSSKTPKIDITMGVKGWSPGDKSKRKN